jgi:hypothetical protein
MARRYVMTPKRRAALRKAQLVSARKRKRKGSRRRKAVKTGVIGTVAVGSVLGYRSYNTRTEIAQRKHLEHKAWSTRVKALPVEFDEDILFAQMTKPHKQPRRYRKRPASVQSLGTIRSTRAKKYGAAGKAANVFGRAVTKPSPVTISSRKANHKFKTIPRFLGVRKYPRGKGYDVLAGNRRWSIDFKKNRKMRTDVTIFK